MQCRDKVEIPRHNFLDIGGENFNNSLNINIVEAVSTLTRCSFDQRYREPIILFGGIEALAELIKVSSTETPLFVKMGANEIFNNPLMFRSSMQYILHQLLHFVVTSGDMLLWLSQILLLGTAASSHTCARFQPL